MRTLTLHRIDIEYSDDDDNPGYIVCSTDCFETVDQAFEQLSSPHYMAIVRDASANDGSKPPTIKSIREWIKGRCVDEFPGNPSIDAIPITITCHINDNPI